MGSHMKISIFEDQTAKALKKWQKAAKQRKKTGKNNGEIDASNASYMSGETTPSHGFSPVHLLHKYKARRTTVDGESLPQSPRSYVSDVELSELEASSHDKNQTMDIIQTNEQSHNDIAFSFNKSRNINN